MERKNGGNRAAVGMQSVKFESEKVSLQLQIVLALFLYLFVQFGLILFLLSQSN